MASSENNSFEQQSQSDNYPKNSLKDFEGLLDLLTDLQILEQEKDENKEDKVLQKSEEKIPIQLPKNINSEKKKKLLKKMMTRMIGNNK